MVERPEGTGDPGRPVMTTDDELCRLLAERAPGRRVVDIGCGTGRRAVALAQAGFAVIGLDGSERALEEARRRAAHAGVDVRWHVVDLLFDSTWPLTIVDAAICIGWHGRGRDADQRRMLARVRRHLAEHGVLAIEQLPPPGDGPRVYDPVTGRLEGGARLYHPVELTTLVRSAGFVVERIETGPPSTGEIPRAARIVAQALPGPPRSLAATMWGEPSGEVRLDLRYADDEAALLDPPLATVWADIAGSAGQAIADIVSHYPVDDPFGSVRGAPVVSRYFGAAIEPRQLTFGAGVTSLLHALSGLADGGPVLAPAFTHPDLDTWAVARGAEVQIVGQPATHGQLMDAIEADRPALLHLDRPTFTAEVLALDELALVARAASAVGAPVVVDESAAAYLRAAHSAVQLVEQADNLVVLRGFTKGYSWGGLRGGFAVASHGVAEQVRELMVPMQIGELALQEALRLLAVGDIFDHLRARIRLVKPEFAALLASAGFSVTRGHEDIPWLVVADPDGSVVHFLAERGIRGLPPVPAPVAVPPAGLLHLTVPLSARRISLFQELISTDCAAAGRPS